MGIPANEPEEIARDFIKTYYQYYPSGVYWYDVSDELILETSVRVVAEVCACVCTVQYIHHTCDTHVCTVHLHLNSLCITLAGKRVINFMWDYQCSIVI